jgi:hypothetical protein
MLVDVKDIILYESKIMIMYNGLLYDYVKEYDNTYEEIISILNSKKDEKVYVEDKYIKEV